MKEPQIHSHITDYLDESHPLHDKEVYCDSCEEMLHFYINECMQTWIETGQGNYCVECFFNEDRSVLEDDLSLSFKPQ